jgi:hypothetical protein
MIRASTKSVLSATYLCSSFTIAGVRYSYHAPAHSHSAAPSDHQALALLDCFDHTTAAHIVHCASLPARLQQTLVLHTKSKNPIVFINYLKSLKYGYNALIRVFTKWNQKSNLVLKTGRKQRMLIFRCSSPLHGNWIMYQQEFNDHWKRL